MFLNLFLFYLFESYSRLLWQTWITGAWETPSLLKSLGFLLEFWLIVKMQPFVWSPLVRLFPSPPVPLSILCWLYRAHQLQLVSPSLSCSKVINFLTRSRYLSFFSSSFRYILWSAGTAKSTIRQVLFFLLTITTFGHLAEIRRSVLLLFLFHSWRDFHTSFNWWLFIECECFQGFLGIQDSSQYFSCVVVSMVLIQFFLCSLVRPNFLIGFRGPFQVNQLKFVLPSVSCSTVYFSSWERSEYLSIFSTSLFFF